MQTIQKVVRAILRPSKVVRELEKFDDEVLSPNLRALRLSINVADILIAMGVSVADVISQALDITDRYCKRRVQYDVSSTMITASQDRGNDREPLTIIRQSQPRTVNFMTVQAIETLVKDIKSGDVMLADAEKRFDEILAHPKRFPYWLTVCGSGLISAGIGVLYGASLGVTIIMFLLATIVSYFLRLLVHQRIPTFFAQIFASTLIVLIAAAIRYVGSSHHIDMITSTNPGLVVIGGIVMLVAGLAIVSAVEDAIDEFYVTANARLLRVVMLTIGIVAGVSCGIYMAKKFGMYVNIDTTLAVKAGDLQYFGAFLISCGYALSSQTRIFGIIQSGFIGAVAWYVYTLTVSIGGRFSLIVASAIAAVVVGIIATVASRIWKTPSIALMTAGIVVLVPGLTLYNGLFGLINGGVGGTNTLFEAGLIALSIASGVGFGHLIARPLSRTVVRARNALPRRQLKP